MSSAGVSPRWIILFGTLALTLVLVNGIMLTLADQADHGTSVAAQYCGQSHERFPVECSVTGVYDCDSHYVLQSDCIGVGEVVLDREGTMIAWCGYTAFDAPTSPSCIKYNRTPEGTNCVTTNLCNQ